MRQSREGGREGERLKTRRRDGVEDSSTVDLGGERRRELDKQEQEMEWGRRKREKRRKPRGDNRRKENDVEEDDKEVKEKKKVDEGKNRKWIQRLNI